MSRLELQGICKGWDYPILDELDLTIEDGEFFCILGPSGISKTTLLRIVAGLELPDAGRVILGGKDITDVPPYHRPVALTFESYALYPHRSVFDNIASPLRAQRLPRGEIEARVVEVARILRIEELLPRRPNEASGGQMQRISLARTLVKRPEVFLLDEPISHLDARIRHELRQQFHRLQALRAVATIYVTHDYTEALSLGDRVGIMGRAGLVQTGLPRDIFERPNSLFVAQHVGQPPINLIDCELRRVDGALRVESQETQLSFPVAVDHVATLEARNEPTLVAGIRPQHLEALDDDADAGDRQMLEGRAELYEALGSMGVLVVDVDGAKLTVITAPHANLEPGQPLRIALRTECVHYFDMQNGVSLLDG